jgi:hypothetical protein
MCIITICLDKLCISLICICHFPKNKLTYHVSWNIFYICITNSFPTISYIFSIICHFRALLIKCITLRHFRYYYISLNCVMKHHVHLSCFESYIWRAYPGNRVTYIFFLFLQVCHTYNVFHMTSRTPDKSDDQVMLVQFDLIGDR